MIKFSLVNNISFSSTTPDRKPMLFVPDVDYISNFFSGDIANVSDVYHRGFDIDTKTTSLTSTINGMSADDLEVAETFLKSSDVTLKKDISTYIQGDKLSVNKSDFIIGSNSTQGGMSAVQKMLLQTLFETQKPYMEIVKLVTDNFLLIEDIIANALCLVSTSKNPRTNPKALNYQKNKEEYQMGMSKMVALSKMNTSVNKDNEVSNIENLPTSTTKVVSVEYSTGDYDPNINYEYTYNNIYEFIPNLDNVENLYNDDEDDEVNNKDIVIFGVFDEFGNKLVGDEIPNWIRESHKYVGDFDLFSDGKYIWENKDGRIKYDTDRPFGVGWEMKTYNSLIRVNGESHYYREPIIDYSHSDVEIFERYSDMYEDMLGANINEVERNEVMNILKSGDNNSNDITKKSIISTHIEMTIQNCFLNRYNGPSIPLPQSPFLPKKIESETGTYYIDPEADYDMKVIRLNPVSRDPGFVLLNRENLKNLKTPLVASAYGEDEIHTLGNRTVYYNEGEERVYYVVEGIHSSINSANEDEVHGSRGNGNKKDYKRIRHIYKLIPKFIKLITKLSTELYPEVNNLMGIFSNPNMLPMFLIAPLLAKLGDNNGTEDTKFKIYTKKFIDDYNNLKTKVSTSDNRDDAQKIIDDSVLSEYVYLDENDNMKLLIDTAYATSVFGINFSLDLVDYEPNVAINTSSVSEMKTQIMEYIEGDDLKRATKELTIAKKLYPDEDFSEIETELNDRGYSPYEGVENNSVISYILELIATPIKIVEKILTEIIDFFKSLINPFVVLDAVTEFLSFKWLTDLFKPDSILGLLGIKMDIGKYIKYLNISKYSTTLTLSEILAITNSTSTIEDLKGEISNDEVGEELLEVGIKDTYDILELENTSFFQRCVSHIGINDEDISLLKSLSQNGGTIVMKDIISMPFIPNLPSYTLSAIAIIGLTPIDNMIKSAFTLIQSIINSFIDLVFSLFGLGSIMDIPHINLTNMIATEYIDNILDNQDMDSFRNLLDNMDSDTINSMLSGYDTDYLFDLSISNGDSFIDLTYSELVSKIANYEITDISFKKV